MYLLLGMGISNTAVKKYFDKELIPYSIYIDNDIIDYDSITTVIKSPGILNDHEVIIKAKEKGIPIITDLELFYSILNSSTLNTNILNNNITNNKPKKGRIIAVTGTNGKSTTVTLVKHIIKDINLAGNIGIPLFDYMYNPNNINDYIIECSSYMGEYLQNFAPDISCVLNIYPNHLKHHLTLENYIECKKRIIRYTKDKIIINKDDPLSKKLCYVNKIEFSKYTLSDIYIQDNTVYTNKNEEVVKINKLSKYLQVYIDDVLASIAICYLYGTNINNIKEGLLTYKSLEHRMEEVPNNLLKIYNDSKSTNFYALKKALEVLNEKTLLICGGVMKNDDYSLIQKNKNITLVITNGENRLIMKDYFDKIDILCISVLKLEDAIDYIKNNTSYLLKELNIQTILFSPGSESFDQFQNFEKRGKRFKELVNNLLTN